MTTHLKFYFSLPKIIKMSIISIGILLIGVNCFKADILVIQMVGILEILIGIATLFVGLKSLLDKNPQVVMNETGIIDNRILKKEIPWNRIEKMELTFVTNQKVLKLEVSNEFKNENFKWLYAKTAAVKLNQNPKKVTLNLDQLKFDYDALSEYLKSTGVDFNENDLFKNLTGWNKILNKMLY